MSQIPIAGPAKPISFQPQGAPQSGFRGFRVEVSPAAMRAVGSAPQIDVQSAVRADLSGASIGEAVAGFGQKMGELALQQFELKNIEKISGAEILLAEEGNRLALDMANEDDETKWGSMLQDRAASVRKALLDDQKLSPRAKAAISEKIARWTAGRAGEVAISSFQRSRQKATENFEVLRMKSLEANDWDGGDRAVMGAKEAGILSDAGAEKLLMENRRAKKDYHRNEANNYLKQGLATGDDSMIEMAVANLELGGATEGDINAFRATASRDMRTAKNRLHNEAQADTVGSLLWRKANGEAITPSEVEDLVKSGTIDERTGAYFMDDARTEKGVLPTEFEKFIDEVAVYDPDDDPQFDKKRRLFEKASKMPMSRAQTQQLMDVFSKAQNENSDAGKKFETGALVGARQQIRQAFSKLGAKRVWTNDLEMALTDTAKLQKFGIAKPVAEKIRALMGRDEDGNEVDTVTITEDGKDVEVSKNYAEAFRLFKSSATTRPDKAESGLTDFEYDLFNRAADSDADGSTIDNATKMNNLMNEPVLLDQFERWFQTESKKNGFPPSDIEVKKKVGQMLSGALQANASASLIGGTTDTTLLDPVGSNRFTLMADGSLMGTASSYGFPGDADNGMNSVGMKRGTQPWAAEMPTVALPPEVAKQIGVKKPTRVPGKKGEWDWSSSIVEIEADGRTTRAVYDEEGMTEDPRSLDKLIDLTPEVSQALGLQINSNAKVIIRKPK